jgi:hypothetical protein
MLKLIYVNPNPVARKQPILSHKAPHEADLPILLPGFTADIYPRGAPFYAMIARDLSHYLSCPLMLEVQETSEDDAMLTTVICHFPEIGDEYLEAFCWENMNLVAMILIQFHVKILEHILLFCAKRNAIKLVIQADAHEAAKLGAYKNFVTHTEEVLTRGSIFHQGGRKTAFTIPTGQGIQDKLARYMNQIAEDFHTTLWQEEPHSPIIRQYLKLAGFF